MPTVKKWTSNKPLLIAALIVGSCAPLSQALAGGSQARMEIGLSGAEIKDLDNSYGLEAAYYLRPNLRARLSYSQLRYSVNRNLGSVSFVEAVDQNNARITLDWFPQVAWIPQQGFYTCLGVTQLGDPATLTASTDNTLNYTLNGLTFSGAQLGNITGTVETQSSLPYIGVGYKYEFSRLQGRGAYLQLEVGQALNLDAKLKLSSDNPSNIANLNSALQNYADQQNDKFEDSYTLYALSFGYRF